jgi:hypothetical protein
MGIGRRSEINEVCGPDTGAGLRLKDPAMGFVPSPCHYASSVGRKGKLRDIIS